jgi:SPP1 gp7 family putative phage head morphogenesis protein
MRRAVTLADGIVAAEELASALLGFSVHKAVDPLSPSGFLLIGQKVAKQLENAVKGAEAAAVADVIHKLGFDWTKLSPDAATAAMNAVNKAIGDAYAKHILPKINETLEVEGPKVMGATKKSVKVHQKIEISGDLAQRDLVAEKAIRNSHVNFIRDSAGDRAATLSKKARSMVATGLGQGLGTDQIGKDLHAFFRENIPRPPSYWRTVADSFVGRARASSQIYAYETAKIQSFEVVAVIDEVTTDQCRFMNGKVFSVTVGRALVETMNALEEPEDVKYAAPWIRKGRDDAGNMRLFVPHSNGTTTTIAKIDRSGVGRADDAGKFSGGKDADGLGKLGVSLPPYHGRCRTVIVAAAETFEQGAPVMVPGADLEPTPAAEPVATHSAEPETLEVNQPAAWMTAETLDVTEEIALKGSATDVRRLVVQDGEAKHKAIWKSVTGEFRHENEWGRPLRDGVKAGTFYQREAAAFDFDSLLGGETVIPMTVARNRGTMPGSLQAFVPKSKTTNLTDWKADGGGTVAYTPDDKLALKLAADPDVRRQFLLDALMANDDRHGANTLWRKVGDAMKPVAIDNGLAFPEKPCRFLFAIENRGFEQALLRLDAHSIELLNKLSLEDVAAVLKKYEGITETQISATLGRIKALQKDPQQLHKGMTEHEAPAQVMSMWLKMTLEDRAITKGPIGDYSAWAVLSADDLAEIAKLSKR